MASIASQDRPVIIGVLNVTPDSFSDGGVFLDPRTAIERGIELRSAGADLIDVGGESTRPGAARVDPEIEQGRIMPVVAALVEHGIPLSVDTMNASTARAAADAGVRVINDVSGGLADPEMLSTAAALGATFIASHWRGHSDRMDELSTYDDVVKEVREALGLRISALRAAGLADEQIVIDPGLGFAKSAEHNWALLAGLSQLEALGQPILIGASRKRFLAPFAAEGAPTAERDFATAVISALAAQAGVWGVRVHDVEATARALDVWSAWKVGGENE